MKTSILSNPVEDFRMSLLRHGILMGLTSISDIGRYLGYEEQTFLRRVRTMSFRMTELKDLFKRLKYTTEEIAEVFDK